MSRKDKMAVKGGEEKEKTALNNLDYVLTCSVPRFGSVWFEFIEP